MAGEGPGHCPIYQFTVVLQKIIKNCTDIAHVNAIFKRTALSLEGHAPPQKDTPETLFF